MEKNFETEAEETAFENWLFRPETDKTHGVLFEVLKERFRQETGKFAGQHLPDGTNDPMDDHFIAEVYKQSNDEAIKNGTLTWRDVLAEEVYEAFAETDEQKLEEELIQVAAVAARWIQDIRFRKSLRA